jgi:hypothetical protein
MWTNRPLLEEAMMPLLRQEDKGPRTEDRNSGRLRYLRPSVLCLLSSVLCLSLSLGCNRVAPALKTGTGTQVSKGSGPSTDEALNAARDIFRKEVGLKSYRNAIQKLNTYFSRHPEEGLPSLPDKERDFLVQRVGLEEDELAEITSNSFTQLDAHYLDLCFLMRDAVRSLGVQELPPLQQVEKMFAWVTRQVRLADGTGAPLPPQFVLRRGSGTSLERALVFLEMLKQMGVDGCLLAFPPEAGSQGFAQFWLPGALVQGQIYLFDTRLGLPLPNPETTGNGLATLEQIRASAEPFRKLALDDKHHYDVTREQARKAEIYLGWSLSAMAPRMKYLQDLLTPNTRITLTSDPAAAVERFQAAAKGIPVQVAARFGDPNPLRVLRTFLPPTEGGTDTTNRRLRAEHDLIPFAALPQAIRNIPPAAMIGPVQIINLGHATFARLFMDFPVPTLRKDFDQQNAQRPDQLMQRRRQGQDPQKAQDDREDLRKRILDYIMTSLSRGQAEASPEPFWMAPRSARDDILRGRYAEDGAATKLVEALEQTDAQKGMARSEPDLNQQLKRWGDEAVAVLREMAAAAQAGTTPSPETQARWNALWTGRMVTSDDSQPIFSSGKLPPWLLAVLGAAAEPLGEEATYLLALCMHEKAERNQIRFERGQKNESPAGAWETAAEWWQQYLDKYPNRPRAAAARLWLARAREARKDRAGAISLLQNLSGTVSPLEATGRLYRARLLQQKK